MKEVAQHGASVFLKNLKDGAKNLVYGNTDELSDKSNSNKMLV